MIRAMIFDLDGTLVQTEKLKAFSLLKKDGQYREFRKASLDTIRETICTGSNIPKNKNI